MQRKLPSARTSLSSQIGTTRSDVLSTMNLSTTSLLNTISSMQTATGAGLATANSQLDAKVSTRATQTSVDSANTKLTFGLDTNMLSRASQTSLNIVGTNLNILTTNLDVSVDLLLRSAIERHLADGNKRVAVTVTAAFLSVNGYRLQFDDRDAYTFLLGLYESKTLRFQELDAWLRVHAHLLDHSD